MSNSDLKLCFGLNLGWATIMFVMLRLIGVISWSWWWVLSPIWIFAGIAILLAIRESREPKTYGQLTAPQISYLRYVKEQEGEYRER